MLLFKSLSNESCGQAMKNYLSYLKSKTRIFYCAVFLCHLEMCAGVVYSQEIISRDALVEKIESFKRQVTDGLHVRYHVTQALVVPEADSRTIHIGGRDQGDTPLPFWRGEHAYRDASGKDFHLTATSKYISEEDDASLAKKVYDGKLGYAFHTDNKAAIVYRGNANGIIPNGMLPDEELYKELLGFESARQNIGNTIRGYKNPDPYDLLTVVKDETYSISLADDKVFGDSVILLEKSNVDRIWLDTSINYSIVRRERYHQGMKSLETTFVNSEFEEVGDGVSLPKKSVIEYYGNPNSTDFVPDQVIVKAILSTDLLSLSAPDKLFEVDLANMQDIVDVEKSLKPIRLAPHAGETMEEFLDNAEHHTKPADKFGLGKILLISVNAVIVLVILILFYIKHHRSS